LCLVCFAFVEGERHNRACKTRRGRAWSGIWNVLSPKQCVQIGLSQGCIKVEYFDNYDTSLDIVQDIPWFLEILILLGNKRRG
jgi:hypothetical protein